MIFSDYMRDRNVQTLLAQWTLVILLIWTGVMKFTVGEGESLAEALRANSLLKDTGITGHGLILSKILGGLSVGAAVLLITRDRLAKTGLAGAYLALLLFAAPLTQLFTNPVWIDGLGGFPAIGAGQGIIKYITLSGLALYLLADSRTQAGGVYSEKLEQWSLKIMLLGLVTVLLWIGGMKFTAVEAAGIEPLLKTHFAFSWMLDSFSLQTASNIIGVTEILTALLLLLWWVNGRLFGLGTLIAAATFVLTLSFLVTLPGWHPDLGFPAVGGTGQFLLKDLGLLAATLLLAGIPHVRRG